MIGQTVGFSSVETAIAQALKASGVIIQIKSDEFLKILYKVKAPLIVSSTEGIFKAKYKYIFSYKGLAFYTKSENRLPIPADAELIIAERIWVPE